MGGHEKLLGVIDRLYEAALDPTGVDALAAVLASAFESDSGFIQLMDAANTVDGVPTMVDLPSATGNIDGWARTAYVEHYHARNLWYARGCRKGFPAVVLCQELVDERTLLGSEWYDYCQKLDWYNCLGAQFRIDGNFVGAFGMHRPRSAKPFEEADRRKAALLLPHVQRAFQVQAKIGAAERNAALTFEILYELGLGVVVVDERARVVFVNAVANRVLREDRGLAVIQGRLTTSQHAKDFDRAVHDALQTENGGSRGGGVVCLTLLSGTRWPLLVAPILSNQLGADRRGKAAIVLFSDPKQPPNASGEALASTFRLTPTEGRLLAALLNGKSLSDFAEECAISNQTARTHLKRVLEKTGHHRQIDLVRSIASDPVWRLARKGVLEQ